MSAPGLFGSSTKPSSLSPSSPVGPVSGAHLSSVTVTFSSSLNVVRYGLAFSTTYVYVTGVPAGTSVALGVFFTVMAGATAATCAVAGGMAVTGVPFSSTADTWNVSVASPVLGSTLSAVSVCVQVYAHCSPGSRSASLSPLAASSNGAHANEPVSDKTR